MNNVLEDRLEIGLNMGPDLLALRAVEVLADVHLPVELQHRLRVGLETVVGQDFDFNQSEHSIWSDLTNERAAIYLEDLQSVPHRLRLVVLPLDEGLSGLVVLALDLGRVEHQVVDATRPGVHEAILDAVNDRLEGHVQVDHDVDRRLALYVDERDGGRIKPIND